MGGDCLLEVGLMSEANVAMRGAISAEGQSRRGTIYQAMLPTLLRGLSRCEPSAKFTKTTQCDPSVRLALQLVSDWLLQGTDNVPSLRLDPFGLEDDSSHLLPDLQRQVDALRSAVSISFVLGEALHWRALLLASCGSEFVATVEKEIGASPNHAAVVKWLIWGPVCSSAMRGRVRGRIAFQLDEIPPDGLCITMKACRKADGCLTAISGGAELFIADSSERIAHCQLHMPCDQMRQESVIYVPPSSLKSHTRYELSTFHRRNNVMGNFAWRAEVRPRFSEHFLSVKEEQA
eukprot:TRINITY_DN21586_c0_g1_i2.p1 TRINITY_DN21586_c0_g1~~TRINITY_DN21586_c0_g1_i2.p1  ORF type:complete len:291 (-),score=38.79 TRINITY_DN21586_c0_g1_i2:312-1184(-)